jgi:hypothetical protein
MTPGSTLTALPHPKRSKARAVLGVGYDPTGKSEIEVMRATVSHHLGAAATSTKGEPYLRAALDIAADMANDRGAAGAPRADRRDNLPLLSRHGVRNAEQRARSARRFCLAGGGFVEGQSQRTDQREDDPRISPYDRHVRALENAWKG